MLVFLSFIIYLKLIKVYYVVSREQLEQLKIKFLDVADGNRELDYDTFKNLLRNIPALSANEQMLDMFCTAFDVNGDGEIEFTEFTTGLSAIFQGTTEQRLRSTVY